MIKDQETGQIRPSDCNNCNYLHPVKFWCVKHDLYRGDVITGIGESCIDFYDPEDLLGTHEYNIKEGK